MKRKLKKQFKIKEKKVPIKNTQENIQKIIPENIQENIQETNKLKIHTLALLSFIHNLVFLAGIMFVLNFSIERQSTTSTTIILAVVLSFVIFKRCIHFDLYDYIKDSTNDSLLPGYTKDNYYVNLIKGLFNEKEKEEKKTNPCQLDISHLRLDIINNHEPFKNCKNKEEIISMCDYKIRYITISSLLTILVLIKLNMKQLIPIFFIWFLNIFKM